MGTVLSVAVAVGVPLAAGVGVGAGLKDDVKGWYKSLSKPDWNPPNWVFGPVWSALYTAMGYSSYLVWKSGGGAVPLTLYGIQLVLNLAWSPLFFKQHEIGFALADITALLGVLTATVVKFHAVDPAAAYIMLPYLGWTTFATVLTIDIYRRNPDKRGKMSEQTREHIEEGLTAAGNQTSAAIDKLGAAGGSTAGEAEGKAKAATN